MYTDFSPGAIYLSPSLTQPMIPTKALRRERRSVLTPFSPLQAKFAVAMVGTQSTLAGAADPLSTGPPTPTFYKCLEEAQGIARSTLFGPIVRKEAVQGGHV